MRNGIKKIFRTSFLKISVLTLFVVGLLQGAAYAYPSMIYSSQYGLVATDPVNGPAWLFALPLALNPYALIYVTPTTNGLDFDDGSTFVSVPYAAAVQGVTNFNTLQPYFYSYPTFPIIGNLSIHRLPHIPGPVFYFSGGAISTGYSNYPWGSTGDVTTGSVECTLTLTPIVGTAPLTVTATATLSAGSVFTNITWGDGNAIANPNLIAGESNLYTTIGVYNVTAYVSSPWGDRTCRGRVSVR